MEESIKKGEKENYRFYVVGILILIFAVWQGIFWIGEYRSYKKYNEVLEQTNGSVDFEYWVSNYSVFKIPFLKTFFIRQSFKDYVKLNQTLDKPITSFEDWEKDALNNKKSTEEWILSVYKEIEVVKNDKYAGDTPEETWEMFLNALKDEDLELASKYFIINKQEVNLTGLKSVEENGLLDQMIGDLSVSELREGSNNGTRAEFSVSGEDRIAKSYIIMIKNINNQWKLESI